jgi:hypothetical protein
MAIADRQAMGHEYYYEEYIGHFEDECEYGDEQLACYYQDYIRDRLRDIRKQLIRRNQPAKTPRHSRWEKEKEMQLRRKQKEEQATEVQVIIYDTEQQQEQKNEDTNGFRRGHNRHDTEHPTPQRRHPQSRDKDSLQRTWQTSADEQEWGLNHELPKGALDLIQDLAGQVQ